MKISFKFGRKSLVALLLLGIGQRAECGWPVIDYSHIITSLANTAKHVGEVQTYIRQFREYRALFQGFSEGLKNWQGLEWVEALSVAEMPFFDGIQGIDDLRDVCAATTMTAQDVQGLYQEIELLHRLETDKRYANLEAYQARLRLMRMHWMRVAKIRMMTTRLYQEHQRGVAKIKKNQKKYQDAIEEENKKDKPSMAIIASYQGKLQAISGELAASEALLNDRLGAIRTKEKHDQDMLNSKLQIVTLDEQDPDRRRKHYEQYFNAFTQGKGAVK